MGASGSTAGASFAELRTAQAQVKRLQIAQATTIQSKAAPVLTSLQCLLTTRLPAVSAFVATFMVEEGHSALAKSTTILKAHTAVLQGSALPENPAVEFDIAKSTLEECTHVAKDLENMIEAAEKRKQKDDEAKQGAVAIGSKRASEAEGPAGKKDKKENNNKKA